MQSELEVKVLERVIKERLIDYELVREQIGRLRQLRPDHDILKIVGAVERSLSFGDVSKVFDYLEEVDYFSDREYFKAATIAMCNVIEMAFEEKVITKEDFFENVIKKGFYAFADDLEIVNILKDVCYAESYTALYSTAEAVLSYARVSEAQYKKEGYYLH